MTASTAATTPGRALLRIAGPVMASNVLMVVLSVNDTFILGRSGATTVAAASVATSIHVVLLSVVGGFALPAQVLSARRLGAQDDAGAARAATAAWMSALGVAAVLVLIVQVFARPILALVLAAGADSEPIVDLGADYLRILSVSLLIHAIGSPLRGFATGLGRTRVVLVGTAVAVIVDVAGGYASLALGLAPLGVAASTVAGVAASALVLIVWAVRSRRTVCVPAPGRARAARADLRAVLGIGAPEAALMAFGAGAGVVTAFLIAPEGAVPLAAIRALDSVLAVLWVAMAGIGAGLTTMIAQALGAADHSTDRDPDREQDREADADPTDPATVADIERAAWRLSVVPAIAAAVLMAVLTPVLIGTVIDDQRVVDAATAVAWLAWSQVPLMLAAMLINGVVRAHGDSRTGLIASLVAEYALFLPLGFVLVRVLDLGLTGIVVSHLVYWVGFLVIVGRRRQIVMSRTASA